MLELHSPGLIASLFIATLAHAVPADLDPIFGVQGRISFSDVVSPVAFWSPHPAVMQPDGKLLLVGGVTEPIAGATASSKISWQIRRVTEQGLPDDSFGVGGIVILSFDVDFGHAYPGDDYANGIALLPDGRFVVAAESRDSFNYCTLECNSRLLLARFNGDGSLDNSFGNGGRVVSSTISHTDSVAIQNDGKILISMNVGATVRQLVLRRFDADGSVDQEFLVPVDQGLSVPRVCGNGTFRIAPDGKIVVVGSDPRFYTDPSVNPGVCVTRLNSDGTPDIAFGSQGTTILKSGVNVVIRDFFVDSAGAITVFAGASAAFDTGLLFRLLPDGTPDATFGFTGFVESAAIKSINTGIGDCSNRTIAGVQGSPKSGSFFLARFLSNGAMDLLFAGSLTGFAETNSGDTSDALKPIQMFLRPDGRIVVLALRASGVSLTRLNVLNVYQYQGDSPCGRSTGVTVFEFYNTVLDSYFITADPGEATAIDHGAAGPGWSRTGETFKSGGSKAICRFYGSLNPGPNSHFYTLAGPECNGLLGLQASTPGTEKRWNFESLDFISTPQISNTCPAGTVPDGRGARQGHSQAPRVHQLNSHSIQWSCLVEQ